MSIFLLILSKFIINLMAASGIFKTVILHINIFIKKKIIQLK